MPFCKNCGSSVEGQFCQRCGTPVAAPPAGGYAPPPPGPAYQQPSAPPPPAGPAYQQPAASPPPGAYQAPGAPPPPPPYYQQPGAYPPPATADGGLTENVAAALCYFLGLITGILFLVLEPYSRSKTIRFHAFQSIFLNVAMIVVMIALTIVFSILRAILPFGMWFLFSLIDLVIWLGFMVLWLFLMFKAYQNQKLVIPIIGQLAEKQA